MDINLELKEEISKADAKKIIKTLARKRKIADIFKKTIKINGVNKNIDRKNITNQYEFYLYTAIEAVQIDDIEKRYDFLYDEICYYLDNVCINNNLCDFKDDKCFAKRNTDVKMGCCHHFPDKKWGLLYQKNLIQCEHLINKKCSTKSIGCKMFMCDKVNKKGYKFTVYNVLLVRYFFNIFQKYVIRTSVFETKENTMKKILKYNFI